MSSEGGGKNRGRRVSIASKDVVDIEPVVYSFKGPAGGSVVSAVQPPNWLYHDHVMGVIWMIFHKENNYVGITQLHWCLKFLLDLKNSRGEYTGDVEICIRAIQDDLIEQYASLGPALDRSSSTTTTTTTEEKSQLIGGKSVEASRTSPINEQPNGGEIVESENNHSDLVDDDNNDNQDENQDEFFMARSEGIGGTSTPNEEEPPPPQASGSNDGGKSKDSEMRCGPRCRAKDRGKKQRETILSFTYDEMMARGPAPCTEPASLVEDKDNWSRKLMEYSGEKSQFGQFANLYSNELVNFLNSSKRQHEASVNRETETLRMLERLMANLNIEGPPPMTNLVRDSSRRQENFPNEDAGKEEAEETKTTVVD